jgi:hypothetical protein
MVISQDRAEVLTRESGYRKVYGWKGKIENEYSKIRDCEKGIA